LTDTQHSRGHRPGRPRAPHVRGGLPDGLTPTEHPVSPADGLQMLRPTTVSPAEIHEQESAAHSGQTPTLLEALVADPDVAVAESVSRAQSRGEQGAGRGARRGRHAAPPPPYLKRRAARFVLFSAIGGFVFLLGFGLQAALTGDGHVLPLVSYAVQAVVSVETSFLLNRWLTWRDRDVPFGLAFARFNIQKTVTIALNLALYAGLLRLGMNYLVANVVLTAVFTVVNYVAGDRLVFIPGRTRPAEPAAPAVPVLAMDHPRPDVSVVIPCRGNEDTIWAAVQSLLDQDYPHLRDIILIGSPGDSTWRGLAGLDDPRVSIWEVETPPGMRDANYKRHMAVAMASGDVIALVDSDIVLPDDWMSRAVAALEESGVSCVAGGMKSFHDTFWGRYTDSTWIGAKTPRIAESYTVTSADFGARGRKPPILANVLFTRELYDDCPIDPLWSHGSYEDYEWFWRVSMAGHQTRVCQDLFGWHHHRRGMRALAREYRRSSRGCAYFIRAHMESPLARRRQRQATVLPLAAAMGITSAVVAAAYGYSSVVAALVLGGAAVLAVHQVVRSRSLESVAYPVVGLILGSIFTIGLVANLMRSDPTATATATAPAVASPAAEWQAGEPAGRPRRRLLHPLIAICAVQAALSLTLVWSNTAYTDEAAYLRAGHLELAHWLHGTSWPSASAYLHFPGSPLIYPPLGALAANVGGIAGARILSLVLTLIATVLLYLAVSRLIGRPGALVASALWAVSEPAMRLAFATFAPLSVLLTALSAWLIMQAGYRRHRGELIAAAAATLAVANTTAYWGFVIDPVVIAFAIILWMRRMEVQQSLSCAAWLSAAWAVSFGAIMTVSHSWSGFSSTVFAPNLSGRQDVSATVGQIWQYAGLIIGLALVGALLTLRTERRNHAALLGGLSFGAFIFAQFQDQTNASLDSRLAYGVWFAVIPAGYACSRFFRAIPGARKQLAALCFLIVLAYPAVASWQSAWERYHSWPDASTFIDTFEPIAANSHGLIYIPPQEMNIVEYYSLPSHDNAQQSGTPSPDYVAEPQSASENYYLTQLRSGNYKVVVLFYSTTFSSIRLQAEFLLSPSSDTYSRLLQYVASNSREPGLPALAQALNTDKKQYKITAVGPYNATNISGTHNYGVYAIWVQI
jgi:putative flippase GtrA/GT2 family glycosyltransferase